MNQLPDNCFFLIVINCGLLPLLSKGRVAYTTGVVTGLETGLNAMASYSCSEGYNLVGDMTRTCQANGQWDGGEPTCMCEYIVYCLKKACILHYL